MSGTHKLLGWLFIAICGVCPQRGRRISRVKPHIVKLNAIPSPERVGKGGFYYPYQSIRIKSTLPR